LPTLALTLSITFMLCRRALERDALSRVKAHQGILGRIQGWRRIRVLGRIQGWIHGGFWGSAREHTVDTWGSAWLHKEDSWEDRVGVEETPCISWRIAGRRKEWIWQTRRDFRHAEERVSRAKRIQSDGLYIRKDSTSGPAVVVGRPKIGACQDCHPAIA